MSTAAAKSRSDAAPIRRGGDFEVTRFASPAEFFEFLSPRQHDAHVRAHRRVTWLHETTADYAVRKRNLDACAAEIIARIRADQAGGA
jgi:hypothetical protein